MNEESETTGLLSEPVGILPEISQETPKEDAPAYEGPEWASGIKDEDLRNSAIVNRYKTPEEAARGLDKMYRQMSSKLDDIPGEDATEEQLNAFHSKLGRPEKIEDYKVTLTNENKEPVQIDERVASELAELGFDAGMTNQQYNKILSKLVQRSAEAPRLAEEALEKEFGKDYPRFQAIANNTFRSLPANLQAEMAVIPRDTAAKILNYFGSQQEEGVQPKETFADTKSYGTLEEMDKAKWAIKSDPGYMSPDASVRKPLHDEYDKIQSSYLELRKEKRGK